MNITPLDIYIWQQADSVISLLNGVGGGSLVATAVLALFGFMISDEDEKHTKRAFIPSIIMALLCGVALVAKSLTPSSKTIALMYVIPNIAKSDVIQKDLPEIYQMAKDAIKDYAKTDK